MKKFLLPLLGITAVAVVLALVATRPYAQPAAEPYVVPALTKEYENDVYDFSLRIPEEFAASNSANEQGGETVVLQDKNNNGIQIVITPDADDTKVLTKEMIAAQLPQLKITDVQPVEVGESHTGLAFKSDNEAFGGASREVWFVFRGNLYQISTYERLDDLLKQIFQTWEFH